MEDILFKVMKTFFEVIKILYGIIFFIPDTLLNIHNRIEKFIKRKSKEERREQRRKEKEEERKEKKKKRIAEIREFTNNKIYYFENPYHMPYQLLEFVKDIKNIDKLKVKVVGDFHYSNDFGYYHCFKFVLNDFLFKDKILYHGCFFEEVLKQCGNYNGVETTLKDYLANHNVLPCRSRFVSSTEAIEGNEEPVPVGADKLRNEHQMYCFYLFEDTVIFRSEFKYYNMYGFDGRVEKLLGRDPWATFK